MSDIGRYRRAYPRLFRHPAFKKLAPLAQRLSVYILFGPQSNRIGLFYFSVNTAAEDLNTTPETLRKALREVALSFGWSFDATARVIFVPSWWRWNPPDHEKVLRGNLKDLNEIPPCGLADKFAANLTYLKPELHETFVEACRVALHRATPSQEQEAVSGKQEQEHSALRAVPLRGRPHKHKKGFEQTRVSTNNGDGSELSPQLVKTARELFQVISPLRPTDELIDAFMELHRQSATPCSRTEAVVGVNYALSEQRSTTA